MLLRLQNSLSAMNSGIREQERIANNLANSNTVGYKRHRTFTETLEEFVDYEGAPRSTRVQEDWAALDQGVFESTGNPLDVALSGEGFFVFSDAESGMQRYSRGGRFALDAGGVLRSPSGHVVQGTEGPIRIPGNPERIDIGKDGSVRADDQMIGRLRVVRFPNPEALQRVDSAGFDAAGMQPIDVQETDVLQGHVETSNVNPLLEMTDLISHFRLFESQQKMLTTADQILASVTRELGKF